MTAAPGVSQDAGYSYIWRQMANDERCIVCLLADIDTDAARLHWRQLPSELRTALRSALQSVIADHWQRECRTLSGPVLEVVG